MTTKNKDGDLRDKLALDKLFASMKLSPKKGPPTSIRCKSRRSSLQHLCVDSHASPALFSFEDGSGRTVLTWRRKCC
ncbi:hypothetical protein LOK49_LG03G03180 [Camellia lanceoleosa]|uniref:Uncharacterized protein n=1 Tax=Camellia lanceoleosa TaxID=1840588 RepID=A0ACC0IE43_9ERIC|nr:hypothetical protein LOK49_LG03G03180 [Camellia lanceoleosa]